MTDKYIECFVFAWVPQKAEPGVKDLSKTTLLGHVILGSRGEGTVE